MKTTFKIFFTGLFFTFSMTTIDAQSPFSSSSHVIHAGFGLGGFDIGTAGISSQPLISASYDHGLIDDLGIGNLGVGASFGFKRYSFDTSNANWTRTFIMARGTYHFHFINSDVLDFYVGANAGLSFYDTNAVGFSGSSTDVIGGPFAGINYYFTENFGVYAEAGYALGIINGGIAFDF